MPERGPVRHGIDEQRTQVALKRIVRQTSLPRLQARRGDQHFVRLSAEGELVGGVVELQKGSGFRVGKLARNVHVSGVRRPKHKDLDGLRLRGLGPTHVY